jgi:hypothetical protein
MTENHGPRTFDALALFAARRLTRNQWFFMPWFGPTGSGKTNDMLQFADKVELFYQCLTRKLEFELDAKGRAKFPEGLAHTFDPERQAVFNGPEYKVARKIMPKGKVVMVDEFIKAGGNRLRSMGDVSVALMEDVNTNRKLGHAVIGGQPFRDDFPPRILKHAHWTAQKDENHDGKAFEVRRVGFRHVAVWEEPRFEFRQPNCEEERPELWSPYIRRAMSDARGQGEDLLAREERVKSFRRTATSLPSVKEV